MVIHATNIFWGPVPMGTFKRYFKLRKCFSHDFSRIKNLKKNMFLSKYKPFFVFHTLLDFFSRGFIYATSLINYSVMIE